MLILLVTMIKFSLKFGVNKKILTFKFQIMKKLNSFIRFAVLFPAFVLMSCGTGDQQEELINSTIKQESNNPSSSKKVIFSATWDDWGRTSRECKGFGLCHYNSCWFCEPLGGKYSGKVEVDDETNLGFLFIELDPSEEIQHDAISNESIFYLDNDLVSNNVTLHQGEYQFDSTVGSYGGYKINVSVEE